MGFMIQLQAIEQIQSGLRECFGDCDRCFVCMCVDVTLYGAKSKCSLYVILCVCAGRRWGEREAEAHSLV